MSASRTVIHADGAPRAVGPYSQAIRAGQFLYSSGQLGLDPASGQLAGDDIRSQTRQALSNLKAVLEAGGSGLAQVVKTTVFLSDIGNYAAMNEVYGEFFGENPPARSAFAVAALPLGALVEIECVALVTA